MRYMEHIDGILDLIDKEFAEMEQNGKFRSRDEVDLVYKMMDIVKDAAEYCEKMGETGDEYSEYYPRRMYPYTDGGMSYARGRGAKRNSLGQYSRENSMPYRDGYANNMPDYSRTDSRQDYVNRLQDLMMSAPDTRTRDYIQHMIHEMERD